MKYLIGCDNVARISETELFYDPVKKTKHVQGEKANSQAISILKLMNRVSKK